MTLQEFKPILTALAMPPGSLLLLATSGLLLWGRWRSYGRLVIAVSVLGLWVLSCNAVAVGLARGLLPQFPPVHAEQLATNKVQAIVVLGGGVELTNPEYGSPQLESYSLKRLRYGMTLVQQTGLPLAFSGGVGWSATGAAALSEAEVAQKTLAEWGLKLRWVEKQSRDTAENARMTFALMVPDKVTDVAIVTNAWHMPRAVKAFEAAGFHVTAAPMGYITAHDRGLMEWLPTAQGLMSSYNVLREWLALRMAAY